MTDGPSPLKRLIVVDLPQRKLAGLRPTPRLHQLHESEPEVIH